MTTGIKISFVPLEERTGSTIMHLMVTASLIAISN